MINTALYCIGFGLGFGLGWYARAHYRKAARRRAVPFEVIDVPEGVRVAVGAPSRWNPSAPWGQA